jgi:hypothetical protein
VPGRVVNTQPHGRILYFLHCTSGSATFPEPLRAIRTSLSEVHERCLPHSFK